MEDREEDGKKKKKKLCFLKIHAPLDVLTTKADILRIKMPINVEEKMPPLRESRLCWPFRLEDTDDPNSGCFTSPFDKDNTDFFPIDEDNKDKYFLPSMRNRIVYYILSRCAYDETNRNKKGIKQLLNNGTYSAAYPLHDGSYRTGENERCKLYRDWAQLPRFFKEQPLDRVRKYYGEKIGIYFAWLGFYTEMLFYAAVVGLICFIYGLITYDQRIWSKEICSEDIGGQIVMCPLCDKTCGFWKLNSTCNSTWQSHLFDNAATVFFAVFMAIWATLFLEFWKRRQARLKYQWDLVDFEEEAQQQEIRPEYESKCNSSKENGNDSTEELELPLTSQCMRNCFSGVTVLFWISLIIASIIGVIAYRLAAFVAIASFMKDSPTNKIELVSSIITPQLATSVTASCINFVIIILLNFLYEKIAIWITDMEIPKTHLEYENRLTIKMFFFQFVNFYSSCFYLAFFKGKFVGYPGEYAYMFNNKWSGLRNEECDPGGCLIELTTQLMIVMTGKQVLGNIQEALMPWLKNCWVSRSARNKSNRARWEKDHDLQSISELGFFSEYLEMVIQFGLITLFVASFPLAPLLALLNNILEVRVDAWKFTTQFRRPVAAKAHSIGVWEEILHLIAVFSVITNAFIVAFTSDMIPRLVYLYVYHSSSEPSMEGYINNSLSIFNISQIPIHNQPEPEENPAWFNSSVITTCRYRDYRNPPGHEKEYSHTMQFWHILAAKLAFIIIIAHVAFVVKFFVAWVIPDVQPSVKARIRRERKKIQEYEMERLKGPQGVSNGEQGTDSSQ